MLEVLDANCIGKYNVELSFNNGLEGVVDLQETIKSDKRTLFSDLKDEQVFQDFKIEHSTLVWSNGLDIAPEYLFFLAFKNRAEYQEQFKSWGYLQ